MHPGAILDVSEHQIRRILSISMVCDVRAILLTVSYLSCAHDLKRHGLRKGVDARESAVHMMSPIFVRDNMGPVRLR